MFKINVCCILITSLTTGVYYGHYINMPNIGLAAITTYWPTGRSISTRTMIENMCLRLSTLSLCEMLAAEWALCNEQEERVHLSADHMLYFKLDKKQYTMVKWTQQDLQICRNFLIVSVRNKMLSAAKVYSAWTVKVAGVRRVECF